MCFIHYLRSFIIICYYFNWSTYWKQNGSKYGYKAENNEYPLHCFRNKIVILVVVYSQKREIIDFKVILCYNISVRFTKEGRLWDY